MADINNIEYTLQTDPIVIHWVQYTASRPNNSQMTYNFTLRSQLGTPGSYIRTGFALVAKFTVGGVTGQVRLKAADNDNWEGMAWRIRTVSVTCPSTSGPAAQQVIFQVVSDGPINLNAGTMYSSQYTVNSLALQTTKCVPPNNITVTPAVSEGNATLAWSGAAPGGNNAIKGYAPTRYSVRNIIVFPPDFGSCVAANMVSTATTILYFPLDIKQIGLYS